MTARVYRVGPAPFYTLHGTRHYRVAADPGDLFVVEATTRPDADGDLSGRVLKPSSAGDRRPAVDDLSPSCLVELTTGDRPVVDVEDLEDVVEGLGGDRAAVRAAVDVARLIASARR